MITNKYTNSTKSIQIVSYFLILLIGSALLIVSSKIKVPFYPVPMTMQTFIIILFGSFFGWKKASLIVLTYLMEGLFGFPVFAGTPEKGLGLSYMVGPTGGYLLGFLFTAFLSGYFNLRTNFILRFFYLAVSVVPIYLLGYLWLGYLVGWSKPIFEIGVQPFILAEFCKILLLALIIPKIFSLKKNLE